MTDFIAKKREIFLVQMSLDTKRAEITKLEERALQVWRPSLMFTGCPNKSLFWTHTSNSGLFRAANYACRHKA